MVLQIVDVVGILLIGADCFRERSALLGRGIRREEEREAQLISGWAASGKRKLAADLRRSSSSE